MRGFELSWLTPRFWPIWLLWPVLRVMPLLPYARRLALGRVLGLALRSIMNRRASIARKNIELCFPELAPAQTEALLKRQFEALGIAALEVPPAWWGTPSQLAPLSRFTGAEHLERALARGKGAILVSAHFVSMEMGLRHFSHQHYLCAIYRPNNNPLLDNIINSGRSGHHGEMIDRSDIRRILRTLKANIPIWYPPDQDHGARNSVFVPFFGIPAATLKTTTRLAKLSGAAVLPCYFHRLPADAGYEIVLLPALTSFPGADETADATRLNSLLEEQIRRSPEQYLWLHRRFKTRPKDELSTAKGALYTPKRQH